ncbi:hypothetical protein BH09SUM1_BH09SUM1_17680 [soil metagenome]
MQAGFKEQWNVQNDQWVSLKLPDLFDNPRADAGMDDLFKKEASGRVGKDDFGHFRPME